MRPVTPTSAKADQYVAAARTAHTVAVEAMDERDAFIVKARDEGATLNKIAMAVDLTDAAILKIYRRQKSGGRAQRRNHPRLS